MNRSCLVALAGLVLASFPLSAASGQASPAEDTIEFFRLNCTSCHTIGGGKLTGPDLKDVGQRQERAWLTAFMLDPRGVIDSGDPYAQAMFQEARGVYMTPVPGMTREKAEKLLDLIDWESAQEKSRFAGMQISDRPLTALDVETGRRLFTGRQSFQNEAPACLSCHTTYGLGALGGGLLGPDLTEAYARLEGRKALAAWLSAPPSIVMQPVFKEHSLESEEVLALVAYLKSVAESGESVSESTTLEFLLSGFAGAAVVLVLFDFLWRGRYRAVRRPLVERQAR